MKSWTGILVLEHSSILFLDSKSCCQSACSFYWSL